MLIDPQNVGVSNIKPQHNSQLAKKEILFFFQKQADISLLKFEQNFLMKEWLQKNYVCLQCQQDEQA